MNKYFTDPNHADFYLNVGDILYQAKMFIKSIIDVF